MWPSASTISLSKNLPKHQGNRRSDRGCYLTAPQPDPDLIAISPWDRPGRSSAVLKRQYSLPTTPLVPREREYRHDRGVANHQPEQEQTAKAATGAAPRTPAVSISLGTDLAANARTTSGPMNAALRMLRASARHRGDRAKSAQSKNAPSAPRRSST
jgi:hypothetical protein